MEKLERQTDDSLAQQLEVDSLCDRFELAWQAVEPPSLPDFIRQAKNLFPNGSLAKACYELAKLDMEFRWNRLIESTSASQSGPLADQQQDAWPTLDEYREILAREGINGKVPADFVTLEYRLRRQAKRPISHEEILQRFPHRSDIAEALDATDYDLSRSTQKARQRQPAVKSRIDQGATIDHFQIVEALGHGAFGTVWRARDTHLGRDVAIKVPRREDLTDSERQQFLKEARVTAQLRHPNIVSVHEAGDDGTTLFIVSDYVAGQTLADYAKSVRLDFRQVANLLTTLCHALAHAHQLGVVHRDLKPSNVIMDHAGSPHITDFGLAKHELSKVSVSTNGQVLGTPAYMSPEQALGEGDRADSRSDVYSLGVILFELLTGEVPFRGTPQLVIHKVLNDEPPRPRTLNPQIPADLETICLKCIEKNPKQRYESADALSAELDRYLQGEPILARPIGFAGRLLRWGRRNPFRAASVALLGLITVVSPPAAIYQAQLRSQARDAQVAAEELAKKNAELATEAQLKTRNAVAALEYLITVLESPDPNNFGRAATVADLLSTAATELESDNMTDEMKARLYVAIGDSQQALGLEKTSFESYQKAVNIFTATVGSADRATLDAKLRLAMTADAIGETLNARTLGAEVYELARQHLASDDPLLEHTRRHLLNIQFRLGLLSFSKRDIVNSISSLRTNIQQHDDRATPNSEVIGLNQELVLRLIEVGECDEANQRMSKLLPAAQRMLGDNHTTVLSLRIGQGIALRKLGQFEEAAQQLSNVVDDLTSKFGPHHSRTLWALRELAKVWEGQQRWDLVIQSHQSLFERQTHQDDVIPQNVGLSTMRKRIALYHQAQIRYAQDLTDSSTTNLTIRERQSHARTPLYGDDNTLAYVDLTQNVVALQRIGQDAQTLLAEVPEQAIFSPDGDRWAYTQYHDNVPYLTLSDLAGQRQEQVPASLMANWSDDGKVLYFYSMDLQRMAWKLAFDISDPMVLIDQGVSSKVLLVSPDGNKLASNQGFWVNVADLASVETTLSVPWLSSMLPSPQFDWSPDSRYLAISHVMPRIAEGIWIVDTHRKEFFRLVHGDITGARWSSDGSSLLVERRAPSGQYDILEIRWSDLDDLCQRRGVSCSAE